MEILSEYLIAATVAAFIAGISEKITPPSMSRYIQFVASILLMLFLLSPIKSLGEEILRYVDASFSTDSEVGENETNFEALLSLAESKVKQVVKEDIALQFSLTKEIIVSCEMKMEENGTVLLTKITVTLSSTSEEIRKSVEEYLEEEYHTESEVYLS